MEHETKPQEFPRKVFVEPLHVDFNDGDGYDGLQAVRTVNEFYFDDGESVTVGEYELKRVIRLTKRILIDEDLVQEV